MPKPYWIEGIDEDGRIVYYCRSCGAFEGWFHDPECPETGGRMIDPKDIEHRFAFHPATTEEKKDAHTSVRQNCRALADFINENCPDGREKALAITHLEEVMFWANGAIARANTEGA